LIANQSYLDYSLLLVRTCTVHSRCRLLQWQTGKAQAAAFTG